MNNFSVDIKFAGGLSEHLKMKSVITYSSF